MKKNRGMLAIYSTNNCFFNDIKNAIPYLNSISLEDGSICELTNSYWEYVKKNSEFYGVTPTEYLDLRKISNYSKRKIEHKLFTLEEMCCFSKEKIRGLQSRMLNVSHDTYRKVSSFLRSSWFKKIGKRS